MCVAPSCFHECVFENFELPHRPWDALKKPSPIGCGEFRCGRNGALRVEVVMVSDCAAMLGLGASRCSHVHVTRETAGVLAEFFQELSEQLT